MATVARSVPGPRPTRRRSSGLARQEARWGLAFLSPWIVGFLAFTAIPMVASLIFSFTDFNLLRPNQIRFVGLDNYAQLFRDPIARTSALVTLRYSVVAVPIGLISPLFLALLLNARNLWAKRLFRTLFFMPSMVPLVSAVYVWSGVLNTETGWVNRFLNLLCVPTWLSNLAGRPDWVGRCLQGPDWLNSIVWIYPSLVIIGLWGVGSMMIVHIAGLQGVPTELVEAARVDGAGPATTFFRVTLPMITPVIFYNLVLSTVGIFQYFLIAYVLSNGTGRPGNATLFYAMHLYREAFSYSHMGYGSTLAWALFVAAGAVTLVLFGTQKYWVYYAGGEAR